MGIHAATAHEAIRQLCERIIGEREPTSWFACIPNRKKLRDEFRTKFISIEATHLPGTDIGGDDDKSLVFGTIMSGQVHASPTVIMNRLRSGLRTGPTAELSDSTALMTHTMMERISSGYAAVTATSRNRSRWDETRRTIEVGAY